MVQSMIGNQPLECFQVHVNMRGPLSHSRTATSITYALRGFSDMFLLNVLCVYFFRMTDSPDRS
jgi:hypothetical protein